MRTIPKERILRVNCAGYGTEAHWNLGRAKSLNNYSAIIVNPVSIAHLFDKDPELVRKVEQCLAEGNTTLTIDDDLLLRNLAAEIDSRVLELSDFLIQGGVLVYFLCRPFVIQGPSLALDNYYWLESLAPDQPAEKNVRHMSAVSHGRLIEPTDDGSISEFAPYLLQHGLEWSTLIRTEYLTEGYSVMAEAGSKKCIAGQLFIMESSGKVVFLPSPYSPDFDKTLIDCLNGWYTLKEQSADELEAEQNEARAAEAAAAAAVAPSIGSGLFEKEQSQYDPGAGAEPTQSGSYQTVPAAAAEPESSLAFNADKIAETVSQDARRFEEEVASRVAREPKKPTASIDLSIFAQTARQLVQKTTDVPASEEEQPAAPSEPEQEVASAEPVAEEPVQAPAEEQSEVATEEPEAPPANHGGGSSLRNLLSNVTPDLPQSVKPNIESSASAMLSESNDAEPSSAFQESPTPPPMVKPKNAAALFADDDEFEDEMSSSEQSQSYSQSETDTSDQNSDLSQVQNLDNSGAYSQAAPLAVDSGVFSTSTDFGAQSAPTDSGVFGTSTDSGVQSVASDSGVFGTSTDSGVFGTSTTNSYSEPTSSENSNAVDSGVYSQPQSAPQPPSNNNFGSNQLPPQNNNNAYEQPTLESPSNNSGVYSQPQLPSPTSSSSSLPQLGTGSGDFNTVKVETPAPQTQAQEPSYSQPEPPVAQPVQSTPPPQAEPTFLQPPSGFMTNFAAQNSPPPVENVQQPAEPPMAQTPVPSVSPAGDNSAVTNNDPSNHENKSTMDLLRELEKAQRPPEQQIRPPLPNPAANAPAAEAVRPLLNNLFKKDATEAAPLENSPPAIPQSAPPAVTHASTPPPPVPTRNTLGALMPAAESRVTVPQENLAMNREGSNAMSNMVVPDWCKQYSFSYLDELKKEQATLASELQDIQAKLNTVESKIASVEQLKAALLSGDGDSLKEATGLVLGKLGWTININNATPNEVLLLNVDQPEALVRIVRSDAHCDRSEVAQVSGSAIAFWEKHDIEPKGLLIACTWANVSPTGRNQKDFEDPVTEFAKKKNLCLITSIQMLGIYRDLELGLVTPDIVRRQMLETNGLLTGYAVEAGAGAMVGAR